MPIIQSAKKRVRTAEKAAIRNSKTKRAMRTAIKAFNASLTSGKKITETQAEAMSAIDRAAKNGVIHKNKAARKKAQLSAAAKAAGVKPSAAKKKAAKPAAKAPAKKATASKPAAAKKPAAKKPAAKK